jgi:hypothetical protein
MTEHSLDKKVVEVSDLIKTNNFISTKKDWHTPALLVIDYTETKNAAGGIDDGGVYGS